MEEQMRQIASDAHLYAYSMPCNYKTLFQQAVDPPSDRRIPPLFAGGRGSPLSPIAAERGRRSPGYRVIVGVVGSGHRLCPYQYPPDAGCRATGISATRHVFQPLS
jgi:hypothetical protein